MPMGIVSRNYFKKGFNTAFISFEFYFTLTF